MYYNGDSHIYQVWSDQRFETISSLDVCVSKMVKRNFKRRNLITDFVFGATVGEIRRFLLNFDTLSQDTVMWNVQRSNDNSGLYKFYHMFLIICVNNGGYTHCNTLTTIRYDLQPYICYWNASKILCRNNFLDLWKNDGLTTLFGIYVFGISWKKSKYRMFKCKKNQNIECLDNAYLSLQPIHIHILISWQNHCLVRKWNLLHYGIKCVSRYGYH